MKLSSPVINIFMTTDEKYMRYMAVSMASILYNTKSVCKFFVLADNVSDFKKRQLESLKTNFDNFEIVWIDLADQYRQCIVDTFIAKSKNATYTKNIANYSRFLMPDLLPNVNRALYLDTDILVYGDIAELYNCDLGNFTIGAIPDSLVLSDENIKNKVAEYISQKHIYFNAGILSIDCKKWRQEKMFDKIAAADSEIFDKKCFNSQDPLNKCFESGYCVLPHKFNWFGTFPNESGPDSNIVIRHFPGGKPDTRPAGYESQTVGDFYFFAHMTPFFDEVKVTARMAYLARQTKQRTIKIKLFGFIPFIKIKNNKVYLFNCIKIFKVVK